MAQSGVEHGAHGRGVGEHTGHAGGGVELRVGQRVAINDGCWQLPREGWVNGQRLDGERSAHGCECVVARHQRGCRNNGVGTQRGSREGVARVGDRTGRDARAGIAVDQTGDGAGVVGGGVDFGIELLDLRIGRDRERLFQHIDANSLGGDRVSVHVVGRERHGKRLAESGVQHRAQ